MDEVRRAEFFRKGRKMRDVIKGKKWLLLSRWKNLAKNQRGVLNRLFQLNRRVFKAYLLKESLENLWDYRYEGAMLNYLQKWIDQLRWQRLPSFQKLAENLPNPMSALAFKQFASDERGNRDLLELKIAAVGQPSVRATLGADMQFDEIHEGDLSYREAAEFLIAREKTMMRRLDELSRGASEIDRNLTIFLTAVKRAHIVELERELALIRYDSDWWKREDAEWRIVHGSASP